MAPGIITYADALRLFGRQFATAEVFEKRTGLKPVVVSGRLHFYSRAEVLKAIPAYDERVKAGRLAWAARMKASLATPTGTDPLDTKTAADLRSEIIGLRSESSAAFNLIMDELSKIKTQLVSMEKPQ